MQGMHRMPPIRFLQFKKITHSTQKKHQNEERSTKTITKRIKTSDFHNNSSILPPTFLELDKLEFQDLDIKPIPSAIPKFELGSFYYTDQPLDIDKELSLKETGFTWKENIISIIQSFPVNGFNDVSFTEGTASNMKMKALMRNLLNELFNVAPRNKDALKTVVSEMINPFEYKNLLEGIVLLLFNGNKTVTTIMQAILTNGFSLQETNVIIEKYYTGLGLHTDIFFILKNKSTFQLLHLSPVTKIRKKIFILKNKKNKF